MDTLAIALLGMQWYYSISNFTFRMLFRLEAEYNQISIHMTNDTSIILSGTIQRKMLLQMLNI